MKKSSLKTLIVSLLLSPLAAVVTGCASGATSDGMTNREYHEAASANKKLAKSIAIKTISGGQGTNPIWTSQISDEDFRSALAASLRDAGFAADSTDARYVLSAQIEQVNKPLFGLSMTVVTVVKYTLKDTKANKQLLNEDITASYTAEFGSAFMGSTRLRLANEGSARKNIGQLLEALKGIDPDKVGVQLK
jgi:hypothetical protein